MAINREPGNRSMNGHQNGRGALVGVSRMSGVSILELIKLRKHGVVEGEAFRSFFQNRASLFLQSESRRCLESRAVWVPLEAT